jgi:DNA-binding transcriptional ArsR family regulator
MLRKSALVKMAYAQAALALKALGAPRRLEILEVLQNGPRSVGQIAEQIALSQQGVSQHLAVLGLAGLVEAHHEGRRSVYVLRPAGFAPIEAFVRRFWQPRSPKLKVEVERQG